MSIFSPLKEDGMTLDLKETRERLNAYQEAEWKRQGEAAAHGAATGVSTGIGYGLAKGVTKGAVDGLKESTSIAPIANTLDWIFGSGPAGKFKK